MRVRFTSRVRDAAKGNTQLRPDRNSVLSGQISRGGSDSRSASFVRLAHLRRLRECDQVAAVCYRVRDGAIEFLLVQTGGGRWTFPKGSAEPGLTHAQAAALEAFEEAGVHGRMEEAPFTRFVYRKRGALRSDPAGLAVSAHLCEVLRLEAPEEANRNPTWFCAKDAKRSLREDHRTGSGADMARVVVRAVRRIRRLQNDGRAIESPPRTARVIDIDALRDAARIQDG
jgi:8-oxo-dGTP pyrophosphatase MutT (NUDIX family)